MDLATLNASKVDARNALAEYRRSVAQRLTAEDRRIMAGLRAQAEGRQVIDLTRTMRQAGRDEHGRPRHIGGDLYAVVALWDLTDLERAVLSDRARRR